MARIRNRASRARLPLAPVAGFSAATPSIVAPGSIAITDESQYATSWLYTLIGSEGGIKTSTERNPTFTFTTGEYWTVTQVVRNRTDTDQMVRTSYLTTVAAPEIEIRGNGVIINDGDLTPSTSDDTDFGNTIEGSGGVTRTFTVYNNGSLPLNRTAPTTVPTGFTVVTDIPSEIPIGDDVPLVIRLDDDTLGPKLGNVQINTDDYDEGTLTFRIIGETLSAATPEPGDPPTTGQVVTKIRSYTAGEQWIGPFGIPGKDDAAWPASNKDTRLWAKQGSNWVPVQTEHFLTRESNGSVRHAFGWAKIPSSWSYTAGSDIELYYGFDGAHPNAPDWDAITASFANDFEVEISEYRPKIYGIMGHSEPLYNDGIIVKFDSPTLGVKTYARDYNFDSHWCSFVSDTNRPGSTYPTVGQTVTGTESGATATVLNHFGQFNYGLSNYNGTFNVGEVVSHPGGNCQIIGRVTPYQLTQRGAECASGTVGDLAKDVTFDGFFRCFQQRPVKTRPPIPLTGITYNHIGESDANDQAALIINQQQRVGYFGFRHNGHPQSEDRPEGWAGPPDSATIGYGYTKTWFIPFWPQDLSIMDEDYTATVQLVRRNAGGKTSTFTVRNGPLITDLVTTTEEPMAVLQNRQARKTYTAVWDEGVDTARSPIFSGHQVHQIERICPLKDNLGNEHEGLVCRMIVTFGNTGVGVLHQARIENSKMFNGSREYFYDVTAIRVGGANQIDPGTEEYYTRRIHIPGTYWEWETESRPIVVADRYHFMHSGLVEPYQIAPGNANSDRHLEMLAIKSRGMHADRDSQWFPSNANINQPTYVYVDVAGYGSEVLNEPLWPASMVFDASGGARGEKWMNDLREWAVWTAPDFAAAWPHIKALAQNGWGAWPWNWRDETAHDDHWKDSPPHLYLKWYNSFLYQHTAAPSFHPTTGRQNFSFGVNKGAYVGYTGTQPYQLWSGASFGTYSFKHMASSSHSPRHPSRTVYLIQGDIWRLDGLESWCWMMKRHDYSTSTPKTGGTSGDINHHLSIGQDNGIRRFAWPFRDVVSAASMMWDGHPKQATYRRWARDLADIATANIALRFHGIYDQQYVDVGSGNLLVNSDTWNTTAMVDGRAGEPMENVGGASDGAGQAAFVDAEKTCYLHAVIAAAKLYEVADTQAAINGSRWIWKHLNDLMPDDWFQMYGLGAFYISHHSSTTSYASDTGFIYATEGTRQMLDDIEIKLGESNTRGWDHQNAIISKTASPDGTTWADFNGSGWFYSPYYGPPGMHRCLLALYSDLVTTGDATTCNAMYELVDTTFPLSTFIGTGDPLNRNKYRHSRADRLGNLSMIRRSGLPAAEFT